MPIGKRQKAIEAAKKRVDKMQPLTEEEVREKLQRIRDIHLMVWLMESETGHVPNRERISNFNQAQHQLERHRMMNNQAGEKNPLDEMGAQWKKALEAAATCATDGAEA